MSNGLLFRPSACERWLACPASARYAAEADARGDERDSEYAREGSAAHLLGGYLLAHQIDIEDIDLTGTKLLDVVPPWTLREHSDIARLSDIVITAEMETAVKAYVNYVYTMEGAVDPLDEKPWGRLYVEFRVQAQKSPKVEGTADVVLVGPDELHVIDLKYGAGLMVDAEDNKQLMTYLLGAVKIFGKRDRYFVHIFQPRGFGKKRSRWEVTPERLDEFEQEVKAATAPKEKLDCVPGDYCNWCDGALQMECDHLAGHLRSLKMYHRAPVEVFDLQDRAELIQARKGIASFLDSIEGNLKDCLEKGIEVPGFKLVEAYGNSTWINKEEAEDYFSGHGLKKIAFESSLLAPGKLAEALKKSGKDEKLVETRTHRPYKGLTLAPMSDKRDAVKMSTAEEDFQ
jgi:hypothetical protein